MISLPPDRMRKAFMLRQTVVSKGKKYISQGMSRNRIVGNISSQTPMGLFAILKERTIMENSSIILELLPDRFTVEKLISADRFDFRGDFWFLAKTDEEISLVCRTADVPEGVTDREDGWKMMRIQGTLDFSLVGILSGIAELLACSDISIFVQSTYNTDYILIKEEKLEQALQVLKHAGYGITEPFVRR